MLEVSLSGSLRDSADGAASISIDAGTIRELLRKVIERYPRMQSQVDRGIAVSINGQIFRDNWGEGDSARRGDFSAATHSGGVGQEEELCS